MAFSRGRNDRPESLIFRSPASPHEESAFPSYINPLSPLRNLASRVAPSLQNPTSEARGSLQRRFTTNALPTLAPIGEQRKQAIGYTENDERSSNRISATEKKAREYEALLAQQRRIQAQMAMIDPETRREVDEVQRLERDINDFTSGVFSEPATPPDHHPTSATGTGSFASKRFSASTLTSPAFGKRLSRTGSQMASPSGEYARPFTSHASSQNPSRSVPGSQRNSDHEGSDDDYNFGLGQIRPKAGANPNRNSTPVTAFDMRNQSNMYNTSSVLGSVNTTGFLFGDDDDDTPKSSRPVTKSTTSPDSKTFLQLHQTDDKFPILVRRETDNSVQFATPSAALDLAADSSGSEGYTRTDRAIATRHRQSLPPSAMRQPNFTEGFTGLDSLLTDAATAKNTAANRRSLEVKFAGIGEQLKRPGLMTTTQRGALGGLPKPSSSYSTNDIPTLKSINTSMTLAKDLNSVAVQSPVEEAVSPILRRSRQNTATQSPITSRQPQSATVQPVGMNGRSNVISPQSALQANATPFGPSQDSTSEGQAMAGMNGIPLSAYEAQPFYGGYGMNMLNNSFGNMSMGGPVYQQQPQFGPGAQPQSAYSSAYGNFGGFQQPVTQARPADRARGPQNRRSGQNEENSRYSMVPVSSLVGEIYGLCKDQHGCRFLQKKLEERNPDEVRLIFEETNPHVVELMTDPFGNYLCQKLLEFTNDDQRTALIQTASPQMVRIALNQHGTRALQKMIEFISTRTQIDMVIEALRGSVVQLIQDLNGNHVIQKCLNHLKQDDAQFVIDSVCQHVVAVGTHRHGCCVLQRCIDHASGAQKQQLVLAVTQNALSLVQDPFGNYVVQYIMDLNVPAYCVPICQSFLTHIAPLSRQKFSSNVVEKGIRTADEPTRHAMITEILDSQDLERMLRDSFANYVVQTAMDYADPAMKAALVDHIRPFLPAIRQAPHGRRIASKVQDYDTRMAALANGDRDPSLALSSGPYMNGGTSGYARFNGGMNGYAAGNAFATSDMQNYVAAGQQQQSGQPSFMQGAAPQYRFMRPIDRLFASGHQI